MQEGIMARQQTQTRRDLMDEARTHQAIVAADATVAAWDAAIARGYAAPEGQFCCVDCEFGNAPYEADERLAGLEHILHDLGV
jgi:stage V sporulation protein SpoVS